LIEGFWQALGATAAIAAIFITLYWNFSRSVDTIRTDYSGDLEVLAARVMSSEIVPQLVALVADVEKDRQHAPDVSVEDILSSPKYSKTVRTITSSVNALDDTRRTYEALVKASLRCSRGCLQIGGSILGTIPTFYIYGLGETLTWISIIVWIGVFMFVAITTMDLAMNIRQHMRSKELLVERLAKVDLPGV